MGKLIDTVATLTFALAVTVGGQYVLKESFLWLQKAALTKASKGLMPMAPFTRKLTGGNP